MVAPRSPNQNLAAIAAEQHGRISWEQLQVAGFSRRTLRTAIADHRLHRVHHGVYAVGHLAEIEGGRQTAALLAVGPGAVLVGLSALEWMNVIAIDANGPVHVAIAGGRTAESRPGIKFHRYGQLLPSQIQMRRGLPTTTAERALLDAAPLLTSRQLERAFDEAIAIRATSRTKVLELLSFTAGRVGQAELAAIADPRRRSARTQSPPEERALELIRAAGLPDPQAQFPLHGFIADFYWPEAGVILEVDGFQVHGTIRRNFVRDRRKDRVFRDHGLLVVRVAAEEFDDQPLQIVAHLTRTLTQRAATRPAPPT